MKVQVLLLLLLLYSTVVVLSPTRGPYRYNNPDPNDSNIADNEDYNWDEHNFFLQPILLDDDGVPIDPESGMALNTNTKSLRG